MEHPNMNPVTTNEELFRLVFPSIMENTKASATNDLIVMLSDSCYALLLYKTAQAANQELVLQEQAHLADFLEKELHIHCFRFHGHDMGIVAFHTWDWGLVQKQVAQLEHSVGAYLASVRDRTGVEFNLSFGRPFMGLLNLRESYSEIINSTMTFTLRPGQLVVSEYDIVNAPSLMGDPYPRSEIERQLSDAIINLEFRKAEDIMENIIAHESSTLRLKLSFLPRMANRMEWMLIVLHVPRNSGDAQSAEIYSYPHRIKFAENMDEGIALIHEMFDKLDEYYNAFRFNIGKDISQITEFITAQANNPNLSATMICDRFRISPSYLSHMFKRRTGIKLVDYIHRTRIDMAKELLESSPMTIADIGLQVGYTSSASFSTTFKRYEALTPREYRDRYLLNH